MIVNYFVLYVVALHPLHYGAPGRSALLHESLDKRPCIHVAELMLIMVACHIAVEQCSNATNVQYSDTRGIQHLQNNVSLEIQGRLAGGDVRRERLRRMRVEASWI